MSDYKEKIYQIRILLNELESITPADDQALFFHNFDALEIPSIVASIVDYLQPLLHPYEAAIYWYLFRKSILSIGQQYTRASTKGMKEGIIQSSSGKSANLSYGAVQKALMGLEEKAVILKAGDTNREGTLYKINLPEEIEICQELFAATKSKEPIPIDESNELDYYNVAENRQKVFERDNYKCHYCNKQLTRFTATLDHVQPVSEGGCNSYDNLVTACLHCNSRRGSQPVMEMYTKGNVDSR